MAESEFKTLITAEDNITDILTGGVYTFKELGRKALAANNPVCAAAYEVVNGMTFMKPCMVIRVRFDTPSYARHDADTQETSSDGVVEFWLYQHDGYDDIDAAAALLRPLLSSRVNSGIGLTRYAQSLQNLVAPEYDNASMRRDDYQFKRVLRD
jgi:hypothetical protein